MNTSICQLILFSSNNQFPYNILSVQRWLDNSYMVAALLFRTAYVIGLHRRSVTSGGSGGIPVQF